MKKLLATLALAPLALTSCGGSETAATVEKENSVFTFEHLDGHGTKKEVKAHIIWDNNAGTYHQFQVGYTSCICRPDATKNERALLYLEYNKNTDKIQNAKFQYYADSTAQLNTIFIAHNTAGIDGSTLTNEEKAQVWLDAVINGKTASQLESYFGATQTPTITGATVTATNTPRMVHSLMKHFNDTLRNA